MRASAGISRAALSIAPFALLFASVILVAVLGWQAFASARSHRMLAERVLHDYADLAATEFGRRCATFVGYYGFTRGVRGLTRAFADSNGRMPSREAIAAAIPDEAHRAMELMGTLLRFNTRGDRFESFGADMSVDIQRTLTEAARAGAGRTEFRVLHLNHRGRTRSFVFTPENVGEGENAVRLGFEVRLDALPARFEEFMDREPLLPPSLAARDVARSAIRIQVKSPDGRVIYSSFANGVLPSISVKRDLADDTAPSGLESFSVVVGIDPAAAESLVIGGLPRSRMGLLVALLTLSVGLALAAASQMYRERRLARAREEFVTHASHELRTPVTRIRMFVETLLLDRVRSEEERRQSLHAIDRASRRLSVLIDNVLQFSRQNAGVTALRTETINLPELAREVIDEFQSTSNDPVHIHLAAPAALHASVDREAVRQILLNLLDNAAKYGGDRPEICVELLEVSDGVRINVDDRGSGVPVADRERIWLPYVRLPKHRQLSIAGTGIGLAVASDLIAQHGGKRWVEDAPGGGARFVVTFPPGATP